MVLPTAILSVSGGSLTPKETQTAMWNCGRTLKATFELLNLAEPEATATLYFLLKPDRAGILVLAKRVI